MLLIRNALIHDAIHPVPYKGCILIEGTKIKQIQPEIHWEDAQILDAEGHSVYPGFIDAHCHIGLDVYAGGSMGMEFNETNDPVTPQLSAIDGINPFDHHIQLAREGGITCICTGPGSSNPMGGTFAAIKTVGKRVDSMVVKKVAAMKCALGENPKRFYGSKKVSSRMTAASLIRDALYKAKIYQAKVDAAGSDLAKRPAYDSKCEALLPVLRREIPLKIHAHQANDLFTAIRIAREFQVKLQLEHVTDGALIADELAAEKDVLLNVGPFYNSSSKLEYQNVSAATPGILAKAGCDIALITDAPVVPAQGLPLFAGMAIQAGLDAFTALQAITLNAARHIGVEKRLGSLEEGKDADIVITQGSPFTLEGRIKKVLINGKIVVDK